MVGQRGVDIGHRHLFARLDRPNGPHAQPALTVWLYQRAAAWESGCGVAEKKNKKDEEEANEPTDQLALGRHEWLSSAADA